MECFDGQYTQCQYTEHHLSNWADTNLKLFLSESSYLLHTESWKVYKAECGMKWNVEWNMEWKINCSQENVLIAHIFNDCSNFPYRN